MLDNITLKHDSYKCIEKVAGIGAQADVYKVQRQSDQKILALKVAKVWRNAEQGSVLDKGLISSNCERIQKEIEFLASLDDAENNYIVNLIDHGQIRVNQYDCPAFVIPWYQTAITKALLASPSPTLDERLSWIKQMIVALKYIHGQNGNNNQSLIHRDFKLDNLLLDQNSNVRLVDFGISKNLERSTDPSATSMNYSPDCVAPEQVLIAERNKDGKKRVLIGPHTDMYALGLVIYYVITLKHSTEQQKFLGELDSITETHLNLLHKDGKGLLGSVGGLNEQDIDELKSAFINLATGQSEEIESNEEGLGTFLDIDDEEIESTSVDQHTLDLADDFVSFVASMTDPEHTFRKDALSASYWIENITKRREPSIETLPKQEKIQDQATLSQTTPKKRDIPKKPVNTLTKLIKEKSTKTRLALAAAAFVVVGGATLTGSFSTEDSATIEIPAALFSSTASTRETAWQALNNLKETDQRAKEQFDAYEEQINQWINSDTPENWLNAIPGLTMASEAGDVNASLWLAYAYQEGRGVETNWEKSWDIYRKLAEKHANLTAKIKQQTLETSAYNILTDDQRDQKQRDLAYQVIEARALSITEKDNTHLWMSYRYIKGDGITLDLERAQYWKNRYDGNLLESVLKR